MGNWVVTKDKIIKTTFKWFTCWVYIIQIIMIDLKTLIAFDVFGIDQRFIIWNKNSWKYIKLIALNKSRTFLGNGCEAS